MKKIFFATTTFLIFNFQFLICDAQTAKVYRAGTLIGTYTNLAAASAAANVIGDSIILSAHIFKEHDVPLVGGQIWQGIYTPIDSTIIDAESKGRIFSASPLNKKRAANIRDIICTNGETVGVEKDGGGINAFIDSIVLRGYSIVRNCHAVRHGGGVQGVMLIENSKLMYNQADSCGGGGYDAVIFDNVEVCYNTALLGGGLSSLTSISMFSTKARVRHNVALIGGGGIYARIYSTGLGYQVIYNQAPLGAGIYGKRMPTKIHSLDTRNAYIYNPRADGSRQNEIYIDGGELYLEGCWFGQSDTVGLIAQNPSLAYDRIGKYAKADWSVNRGKPLTKADTLFPIGAAFTYNDGSPLPLNSCPWLVGNFSSTAGKMLSPKPTMSATDTLSSLFRTYVYPAKGDTSSKFINYLCYVDADTFRASPRVWGIDSISLDIKTNNITKQVKIYPNPASDVLNIQGAEKGDTVELYDMQGRMVKREVFDNARVTIDIATLKRGNYLLKIRSKDGGEGCAKISVE